MHLGIYLSEPLRSLVPVLHVESASSQVARNACGSMPKQTGVPKGLNSLLCTPKGVLLPLLMIDHCRGVVASVLIELSVGMH